MAIERAATSNWQAKYQRMAILVYFGTKWAYNVRFGAIWAKFGRFGKKPDKIVNFLGQKMLF